MRILATLFCFRLIGWLAVGILLLEPRSIVEVAGVEIRTASPSPASTPPGSPEHPESDPSPPKSTKRIGAGPSRSPSRSSSPRRTKAAHDPGMYMPNLSRMNKHGYPRRPVQVPSPVVEIRKPKFAEGTNFKERTRHVPKLPPLPPPPPKKSVASKVGGGLKSISHKASSWFKGGSSH